MFPSALRYVSESHGSLASGSIYKLELSIGQTQFVRSMYIPHGNSCRTCASVIDYDLQVLEDRSMVLPLPLLILSSSALQSKE